MFNMIIDMRWFWIIFLALAGTIFQGCNSEKNNKEVSAGFFTDTLYITDARARPAIEQGAGSVYFTIRNGYDRPDTLISARSPAAGDVQIHESYLTGDGLSGMRQMQRVVIPAQSSLPFQPGGLHVMLLNLSRNLQPNDSLQLSLVFAHHDSLQIQVPVRE